MKTLLYGVSASDPMTFDAVTLLLGSVALARLLAAGRAAPRASIR